MLLFFPAYTSSSILRAKQRYKRAEFVGCYPGLIMFAFMLYILLEVIAYFSIMVGSAYPREFIHGGYMLGSTS